MIEMAFVLLQHLRRVLVSQHNSLIIVLKLWPRLKILSINNSDTKGMDITRG